MEGTETGKDKVKKICEVLRQDTLEPAMKEAKSTLEKAQKNGEQIIEEAKAKETKMIAEDAKDSEQKYQAFKACLNQDDRQSLYWINKEYEERVLNEDLSEMITKSTATAKALAEMIKAVIEADEDVDIETDQKKNNANIIETLTVNDVISKDI